MGTLIIKVLVTAVVVVAISELAKRSTLAGALLASLPLTSLLGDGSTDLVSPARKWLPARDHRREQFEHRTIDRLRSSPTSRRDSPRHAETIFTPTFGPSYGAILAVRKVVGTPRPRPGGHPWAWRPWRRSQESHIAGAGSGTASASTARPTLDHAA